MQEQGHKEKTNMKKIFAACCVALGFAAAANAMDGLMYSIDIAHNGMPVINGAAEIYLLSGEPEEKIAFIIDTVAGEGPSLSTVYGVAPVAGDTANFAVAGCSFKMKLSAAALIVSEVKGCSAYMSGIDAKIAGTYKFDKRVSAAGAQLEINTPGVEGQLTVVPFKTKSIGGGNYLGFSLSTVSGPTSQLAQIDGVAAGINDNFTFRDGACQLKLSSGQGNSVIVSNGDETCRKFMGASASVNGRYNFTQPK